MNYSALIGNPVEHSVSPSMFKYISKKKKIEYEHLKIKIDKKEQLEDALNALNLLGFCGVNVTIPYKIDIAKFMNEIDDSAKSIESVNTIKFNQNGFIGYNTDGIAAIKSIENKLCKINENTKILIIGAGGAARPICYEAYKRTKNITVMNRYKEEAESMIACISKNIPIYELSRYNYIEQINKADIIINATPVGMHPKIDEELIEEDIFKNIKSISSKYFFDVIFNPYKTKFLINAEKYGAKTCSGLYMMIYQILLAFEIWTDIKTDDIDIEDAKIEILENGYNVEE